MTRKQMKDKAKGQLKGNWKWAVLATLINILVLAGLEYFGGKLGKSESIFSIFGVIVLLLAGFIGTNLAVVFLNLSDMLADTNDVFASAFNGFEGNNFKPLFINYLLSSIFKFLWGLLLFFPGVVKHYSYAMSPYIVRDYVRSGKDIKATEAIKLSRELMKGHKLDLFVLDLSFIGWEILASMTLGIGYLWLIPYMQTTKANFFHALAGEKYLH